MVPRIQILKAFAVFLLQWHGQFPREPPNTGIAWARELTPPDQLPDNSSHSDITRTSMNAALIIAPSAINNMTTGAETSTTNIKGLNNPVQYPRWYDKPQSISASAIFTYMSKSTMGIFDYKMHSCKGMCGNVQFHICSCRPSCLALKSCCVDFIDLCMGIEYPTDEIESNFSWLQEVNKECLYGNVMVTSCRHTNLPSYSFESPKITLLQRLKQKEATWANSIDVIRLLVHASVENLELTISDKLAWILSSVPIEDTSTGILFANASVFDCNGAQWSSARPGHLRVEYNYSRKLSGEQMATLEGILTYADFTKVGFHAHPNVSPCRSNAISRCPPNYTDGYVNGACEHTSLYMRTLNIFGDPESAQYFKNPFCQACNIGLNPIYISNVAIIMPMNISLMALKVDITNSNLLIKPGVAYFSGMPMWETIACNLTNPLAILINESRVTGPFGQVPNTACAVTKCHSNEEKVPSEGCSLKLFITFLLPPAAKILEREELVQNVCRPFIERLSQFMGDWNIRFSRIYLLYLKRMNLFSMVFQYSIVYEVKSDFYFIHFQDERTVPWNDLGQLLWSEIPFPFNNDSLYFCLVISRKPLYPPLWSNTHRCWDVPRDSGAIIYNSEPDPQRPTRKSHPDLNSAGLRETMNIKYHYYISILSVMAGYFLTMLFDQITARDWNPLEQRQYVIVMA